MISPRPASPAPVRRGFTLVETLVAIAILMIALVGPFYMLQQAINASYAARDQLIASSLAQEGVEFVYYRRHNNFLQGQSWLTGLTGCSGGAGCAVDPTQDTITPCASRGCDPLRVSQTGLYAQSGTGPESRFTRTVFIQEVAVPGGATRGVPYARVTVRVTWTNRVPYTVEIVSNIYDWL